GGTGAGGREGGPAASADGAKKSSAPTAAATRLRRSRILLAPPPLGCTRLVRMIMYVRVGGSIQTAVPVNPVWPTEFIGKNGAISPENDEDTSQPRLRTPSGWGERCHIICTVDAFKMRLPSSSPSLTSMRQIR